MFLTMQEVYLLVLIQVAKSRIGATGSVLYNAHQPILPQDNLKEYNLFIYVSIPNCVLSMRLWLGLCVCIGGGGGACNKKKLLLCCT